MRIPKYQWLMPQPNTSCGFCDELAVSSEFDKNFQLIADKIEHTNIYPDGDFSINPFAEITSNDLSFELVLPMAADKYFTLYLGTEIIIFKSGSTTAFTHVGNIWVSTLPNLLKPAKIVEFLNDNIDPLIGTTSSETSGVILIEDVPSGSYVDDTPFSTLINVTTVTPTVSGMYLYNGYYDATTDKIKYLYISDFYTPLLILQASVSIVNGTTYEVSYGYISQSAFEYQVAVSVYYNPSAEPLINSSTERTISYLFTSPATTTATVGIRFTPTTPSTAELSIDNIVFKELEYQTLDNVEVVDCDGIETEIDFATTIYN